MELASLLVFFREIYGLCCVCIFMYAIFFPPLRKKLHELNSVLNIIAMTCCPQAQYNTFYVLQMDDLKSF